MSQNHTKLHEALELLNIGELSPLSFLKPSQDNAARAVARDMLKTMTTVPHYVFSDELMKNIKMSALSASMNAMEDAGVMRLPFPTIAVELWMEDSEVRVLGLLTNSTNGKFECACILFQTLNGNKRALSPTMLGDLTWRKKISRSELTDTGYYPHPEDGQHPEDSSGWEMRFTTGNKELDADKTSQAVMYQIATGAMLSIMMTNIGGIEREVIDSRKLNKHRERSGKIKIPTHTVVRLGHVYDKSGNKVRYVAGDGHRGPVRIHMRAAHTRRQQHGPEFLESEDGKKYAGLSSTTDTHHVVLIDAVLVNYKDGTELEKPLPKVVRF